MSRRHQTYGQYKRARQRRERYAARYKADQALRSSMSSGRAFLILLAISCGLLALFWPLALHGAARPIVLVIWLALVGSGALLYRTRWRPEARAKRREAIRAAGRQPPLQCGIPGQQPPQYGIPGRQPPRDPQAPPPGYH